MRTTRSSLFALLRETNPVSLDEAGELAARIDLRSRVDAVLIGVDSSGDPRSAAPGKRRRPRRLAVLAAAAAVIVAVPAIAAAVDPTVLPWNGQQPAPQAVVQNFASFGEGAPPGMNPQADASQARGVPLPNGGTLWVAPSATGFCVLRQDGSGGCYWNPLPALGAGVQLGYGSTRGAPADMRPITVSGVIGTVSPGSTLEIDLADGTTIPVPIVWVGSPINAGLYQETVPPGPQITAVVLRDPNGNVIATKTGIFSALYAAFAPDGLIAGSAINPATGAPNAADASKAQVPLIASAGSTLSTAPRSDGNGSCVWVTVSASDGGGGFTDCEVPASASPELALTLLANETTLFGQVGSDVASVTLQLPDGTTKTLTPVQGWVLLGGLPASTEQITATAYDTAGNQVAAQTVGGG